MIIQKKILLITFASGMTHKHIKARSIQNTVYLNVRQVLGMSFREL